MNPWESITVAILGNATILAILGWLSRSLFEKLIQRDSKQFEIELKAKADSAIEKLRNDLQIRTIEHQVRFSRLHEEQATVIAELNGLLVETLWEAESFLSPMEWAGEPNKQEKHDVAMNKLVELYRYFDKHRIYLPELLCEALEQLITEVRKHVINSGTYLTWDDRALTEETRKEKREVWKEGWNAIKNQVPAVRKKLEDEFRAILGSSA